MVNVSNPMLLRAEGDWGGGGMRPFVAWFLLGQSLPGHLFSGTGPMSGDPVLSFLPTLLSII